MRSLLPILSLCFLYSSAQETVEVNWKDRSDIFKCFALLVPTGGWVAFGLLTKPAKQRGRWAVGHLQGWLWFNSMVKRLVTFDHFLHCHCWYHCLLVTLQDCLLLIICKGFLADGTVFDSSVQRGRRSKTLSGLCGRAALIGEGRIMILELGGSSCQSRHPE